MAPAGYQTSDVSDAGHAYCGVIGLKQQSAGKQNADNRRAWRLPAGPPCLSIVNPVTSHTIDQMVDARFFRLFATNSYSPAVLLATNHARSGSACAAVSEIVNVYQIASHPVSPRANGLTYHAACC